MPVVAQLGVLLFKIVFDRLLEGFSAGIFDLLQTLGFDLRRLLRGLVLDRVLAVFDQLAKIMGFVPGGFQRQAGGLWRRRIRAKAGAGSCAVHGEEELP